MPVLRAEIIRFVRTWNTHKIRRQNNRPNAVPGKPFILYNAPGLGVQDWSQPVNLSSLRTMREQHASWDLDTYLPPETYEWCQVFFASIEFNPMTAFLQEDHDIFNPSSDVYLQLRTALQAHIDCGNVNPVLSIVEHPTGGEFNLRWNDEGVQSVDLETDQDN